MRDTHGYWQEFGKRVAAAGDQLDDHCYSYWLSQSVSEHGRKLGAVSCDPDDELRTSRDALQLRRDDPLAVTKARGAPSALRRGGRRRGFTEDANSRSHPQPLLADPNFFGSIR